MFHLLTSLVITAFMLYLLSSHLILSLLICPCYGTSLGFPLFPSPPFSFPLFSSQPFSSPIIPSQPFSSTHHASQPSVPSSVPSRHLSTFPNDPGWCAQVN